MAVSEHEPYRSPEGTYERILKSVLEDWTLTDAERSLLAYLATKPAGWKFYTGQLTKTVPRTERSTRRVLASLARHGYLAKEQARDGSGQFGEFCYLLRRDQVLALGGDGISPGQPAPRDSGPPVLTSQNESLPSSDRSDTIGSPVLTSQNETLPSSGRSDTLPLSGVLADIEKTDLPSDDTHTSDDSRDGSDPLAPGDSFFFDQARARLAAMDLAPDGARPEMKPAPEMKDTPGTESSAGKDAAPPPAAPEQGNYLFPGVFPLEPEPEPAMAAPRAESSAGECSAPPPDFSSLTTFPAIPVTPSQALGTMLEAGDGSPQAAAAPGSAGAELLPAVPGTEAAQGLRPQAGQG